MPKSTKHGALSSNKACMLRVDYYSTTTDATAFNLKNAKHMIDTSVKRVWRRSTWMALGSRASGWHGLGPKGHTAAQQRPEVGARLALLRKAAEVGRSQGWEKPFQLCTPMPIW